MKRRDFLRATASGAVLAATADGTPAAAPAANGDLRTMPQPPNIVILHCHDLGRFLHCYGVDAVQSPNLDRLAAEGVRFARSFCTAPQCSPSRASLFTGRYPHANGVMGLCHADFAWDLHPEERHLGEILKAAGYRTAGVGVLHETRSGPGRCGLDQYRRESYAIEAAAAAKEVLAELAGGDTPFYLQVGFIEPHRLPDGDNDMGFLGRHVEPDSSRGVSLPGYLQDTEGSRTEIAELQGAVRHADRYLGEILDAIDALGLRDHTLVVFTADHGVAMPRAKCSIYDPGLEVALILRLPSRRGWHGGAVHEPMVQNVDLVPSVLDLIGLPMPGNLHGRSFTPLLDGGLYEERTELFGEMTYHDYYDPRRCIRTDTHKLIVNFSTAPAYMDPSQSWRPRSDTREPVNRALVYHPLLELYDLRNDPWELDNLADRPEHAATRDDLVRRLHAHLVESSDPILQGAVTSPMHRRAMEALGGARAENV